MEDEDLFSNFKSAIEWPDMPPPCEEATADFVPLSQGFRSMLETWTYASTIAPDCDSEIEIDLGTKLIRLLNLLNDDTLKLEPQLVMGRYRYDFAVLREGQWKPLLLIECDGKAFHETPEQRQNDAAKDQVAAKAGIPLLRFSGSQIYRDISRCIYKVVRSLRHAGHLSQEQWDMFERDCVERGFVL